MPPRTHDIDAFLQSILKKVDEAPAPAVDVEAALADPVLRGVIERTLRPYERILTEKAMEHARRTLVLVFTTDPASVAALAKAREQAASGAVAMGQQPSVGAPRRRQRRTP